MKTILFAGVDIGSTTSKCVITDGNDNKLDFSYINTSYDRSKCGDEVLNKSLLNICKKREDINYLVSTGYGRRALNNYDKALPEIVCHARGTAYLCPEVRTIIDIGGQDSKVIELQPNGRVLRFQMNDKCAAGTGRFFEVLTGRLLGIELDDLGELSLKADDPCTISSMCTVFAESEIISLMSEGKKKENIIAGMNNAVAKRVLAMGKSAMINYPETIVFSGGVARNIGVTKAFEKLLNKPIKVLENPQATAALGAALFAKENFYKEK